MLSKINNYILIQVQSEFKLNMEATAWNKHITYTKYRLNV